MIFSEAGIRRLSGLHDLEQLHLVRPRRPCRCAGFPHLKHLSLGNDQIDDACAAQIATLRDLQTLALVYTKITDDGLKKIAELRS